ncbi:hypothetical protein [Streptomyces sp. NPDC096132]|uniref:WYL domain-containing protein n=1 Tax=Streptomyces sp. NPDC096132 TaxID=3366075 RepID=UPI0037F9E651
MAPTPSVDADRTAEPQEPHQEAVRILYVNYRGEKSWRRVHPVRIWFGATEWHPENQWLMDAVDLDKEVERSFALKDIHSWEELGA